MRSLFVALAVLTAFSTAAFADEDSVDTGNGEIAVMGSGDVYRSTDGTGFGSWQGDDVTITDNDTMVDHDTGEEADIEKVN